MAHIDYTNGYYDGDVNSSDERHGFGVYYFKNGNKYVGEWENDKRNGHGTFYRADGDRYEGNFVDGKANGHGTYYWAKGDKYTGEWKNNAQNGRGVYCWQKTPPVWAIDRLAWRCPIRCQPQGGQRRPQDRLATYNRTARWQHRAELDGNGAETVAICGRFRR